MTTAEALQSSFQSFDLIQRDDIKVTRNNNYNYQSFSYSIYFQGARVLGNIEQMKIDQVLEIGLDVVQHHVVVGVGPTRVCQANEMKLLYVVHVTLH